MRLTGGKILTDGGLVPGDLGLADGRIDPDASGANIDVSGLWLCPGIIDVHGDGFERHIAPRRGAGMDMRAGVMSTQAELLAHGITTATLAQFWSWEGGMRSPDAALRLIEVLDEVPNHLDLRVQLRVEISLFQDFPDILELVETAGISYVVLNDHLPHKALSAGRKPPRLTGQALKSGRSPEAHHALLKDLFEGLGQSYDALPEFAAGLKTLGAKVGSHDDHTEEDVQRAARIGVDVSEFPETLAAAQAAQSRGFPVVMGAPNVVRGGSHDKKVSAREVNQAGACTALASDYHYPTLLAAAFAMIDQGILIQDVWPLISAGGARVLGLSDRGSLDTGLRGDIVVIDPTTRRVAMTICAGNLAYFAPEAMPRLIGP